MLTTKLFSFNPLEENCILLTDDTLDTAIVDPGCFFDGELDALKDAVSSAGLHPVAVLLTHGHPDHVWGLPELLKVWDIPVYMNPADEQVVRTGGGVLSSILPPLKADFKYTSIGDGDIIRIGDSELKVIATPGHTPGSVCYYSVADKLLITGDTLFAGTIGRTDLPFGEYDDLIRSVMDSLMGLDGDVQVIPGHGTPTDIGYERTHNPFLQPWGNPEDDNAGFGGIPIMN